MHHACKHGYMLCICPCERLCSSVAYLFPEGEDANLSQNRSWYSRMHLKAFILGRHISLLSLQREREEVRVSSDCCQRSVQTIGEKNLSPKNRTPCHVHKERQSPDDTLVCQISVIKIPPSHRVGRHLELAAGQVGVEGWRCGCSHADEVQCGDVFPHGDGE